MEIVQVIFPTGERLPMLLDQDGQPVVAVCEWILTRRHRAFSTLSRNTNEIKALYLALHKQRIDLFERIRSARPFREAEITALVEHLRRPQSANKKITKLALSPDSSNKRLATSLHHIQWCFDLEILAEATSQQLREKLLENRSKLTMALLDAFQSPEGRKHMKKKLTAKQAQFIQDLLDPDGEIKFGRDKRVRLRNFLAIMLLLNLGIRIGELLSLRVRDVQFGAITTIWVRRRGMALSDTRARPARVKRASRPLPLDSPRTAILLDDYLMNEREWFLAHGKRKDNGFLFLSDEGDPLSADSLWQLCAQLRLRYPEELPTNLSPHSFRHTFSDGLYRELRAQGMSEDEIQKILMWLRGDTSPDSQDAYIDYGERGRDALQRYQQNVSSSRNAPDVPF